MSAAASAVIVPDFKLDKLCSMLELFHVTPPATYSELPLEDAVFDQDEPALNQQMWEEILKADYLSDIEPINDITPEEMLSEEMMKEAARALEEDTLDEETTAQHTALDAQREHMSDVARHEAATPADGGHAKTANDEPPEQGEGESVVDASSNESSVEEPFEGTAEDYSLDRLFDDKPHENTTSGVNAPTCEAPKHEDDESSDYSLCSLFDEEATSGEQTHDDAVPESAVIPGTPPDEQDDVTDEESDSDYSLESLFNDMHDEHGESTRAVDAPSAGPPTEAKNLPADDDASAGDKSLAIHPQTLEASNDDTENHDTTPEEASVHNELSAHTPIADIAMVEGITEHTPVGFTPLKAPVEEANAMDISKQDTSTDKALIDRAPMKSAAHIGGLRIEFPSIQNTPIKDAEVLEAAPLEEAQAESASAEHEEEEYDPERAPIEYAPQSTEQTPLQDIIIDDAPVEYIPIEQAPMTDVPMDDAPKDDTNTPDALATADLDPTDALNALSLLPQPVSAPHNDFIKAETARSPTVSPLSSPASSPPPQKGLRQLVTASKSATTLQQQRKRKVDEGRHSVSPPAKRTRLDTATTASAPVPRLKRRLGQGVSARGGSTRRVTTRSVTAATKLAVLVPAPAPAPSPVVPPFPTTPLLGKRKAYTGNAGNSPIPSASANKRRKLSPPPAPEPAHKPPTRAATAAGAAAATSTAATVTRRKTAIPTVTARHTRSMGPKCLLYSADILALERGLRRRG